MSAPSSGDEAAWLAQVPLFAHASADALRLISRHLRRRRCRAGETLFFAGDPGHTLYIIVSGSVKICRHTPGGDRVVIALLGPGQPFGEMSLLDGEPRSADAIVADDAEVVMLDRERFEAVLRENPTVALEMLAELARRLRRTDDSVNLSSGLSIGGRVARQLLELSQVYGEELPGGGRRLRRKVTQQEIAEMVGCTRESVNKTLGALKREKAVLVGGDGHLVLKKIALLGRRAAGC